MAAQSMADQTFESGARLDSWKDIAAYLKRDVSTVQRWEKREGMPIHRHLHDRLGSVYAFTAELDAWSESRRRPGQPPEAEAMRPRDRRNVVIAVLAMIGLVVAIGAWLLRRTSAVDENPLSNAQFVRLTDFDGTEQAAAISRDGRFVAFLSDRDGPFDVWLTQVGTGQFVNLTHGKLRELVNPDIRLLGFSPDASQVSMWVRKAANPPDISVWTVGTLGGEPKLFLEGAAEFDWSTNAKRLVYHTPAPGDPMFIKDRDSGDVRPLSIARAGLHEHYPLCSHDDRYIYFVMGAMPDKTDLWRIKPGGGDPERMTSHNSRVTFPAFVDARTLIYLATDADGDGPWLYALDTNRGTTRRISFGVERYTSIDASADGRHLVATVANRRRTMWRIPIGNGVAAAAAATRVRVPVVGGRSPRVADGYLLYVSARGNRESIWRIDEPATELWSGAHIVGGPAISPDGQHIAFSADKRLYVMNADGSGVHAMPDSLQPQSAPAWSPDGQRIVVSTAQGLFVTGFKPSAVPARLTSDFAADPLWSPDGTTIVFSGMETGTTFPIRAVPANGGAPQTKLTLSRGVRHVAFMPHSNTLVVLRGDMVRKDFWAIDLNSGQERRLTDLGPDFVIGDYDVSPDGTEIAFDREENNSDIVMINR
jgi:Tol biopolymer transport system component